MSTFVMDMMLNAGGGGGREKNINNTVSRDWRGMIGCYDNRQEDGMPSLIHKNYPVGTSAPIPSLPPTRPSLHVSRQSLPPTRPTLRATRPSLQRHIDKTKDFQSYPWQKRDNNMFGVNGHVPNIPNGFYEQDPRHLKKDDLVFQRQRETNGFSERNMYNYSPAAPSNTISALHTGRATSDSSNTVQKNVTWKVNGMSSNSSTKSSPGTWNSLKENDKYVWEDRMKKSAELLKLYKHRYSDLNQNVYSAHGKTNSNGFMEPGETEPGSRDKIYLNINPQKDNIDYEPLSKITGKAPPLSYMSKVHSPSRPINGYKSNAGILISTEEESKKTSFSVDNIIERNAMERNGNINGVNYRTPFEHSNSRLKSWRSKSISNLSERVDSLKNGHTKSAFSPPHNSKIQPKTSDIQKTISVEYPNTLMKTSELIGGVPKENKLIIVDSPKENKTVNEQRPFENKDNSNGHTSEFALPFKLKMKRSLAIYLGVDPEIDTVQYEPLNKNSAKVPPLHGRHVFSSQHSKGHEIGHKDDRDLRIHSKKKSVYSCGYDVNSINIMLQNAKKRFKCSDTS